MEIKTSRTLPTEAAAIRREVFMEEQGFQDEFDQTDEHCLHLVLYENGEALGTCRCYRRPDHGFVIGRIAVKKAARGKRLGSALVQEACRQAAQAGEQKVSLLAQQRAAGFYEKNGFVSTGDTADDEGCLHVWMELRL